MNQEVFAALAEALERGEEVALVTIVAAHGSTPQRVGAKMLVYPDGRTVGTIGGGCYENDAFWKAREAITQRRPMNVKYELNDDFAQETGLVCGGQMEVFIEPVEASPDVYVFGAGHVGYFVAKLAHEVGFRVHDRFATRYDHDVLPCHRDAARGGDVLGNRLAEVREPGRRSVTGPSFVERPLRRFLDVRGRWKVRLSDFQMDDVLALGLERARLLQHFKGGLDPDTCHSFS